MSYTWTGENWGRSLIIDAIKAGYTVSIRSEGDTLYKGTEPLKAWAEATSVDECHVRISKPDTRTEVAFLVFDCDQNGDEVINDFSTDGWIEAWWEAKSADSR